MSAHPSELIAVVFDREGAPTRFHWRGRVFRVDAIERIRRPAVDEPLGRRVYTVRSGGQRFLICHDRVHRRWAIVRSPVRLRLQQALASLAVKIAA